VSNITTKHIQMFKIRFAEAKPVACIRSEEKAKRVFTAKWLICSSHSTYVKFLHLYGWQIFMSYTLQLETLA